MNLFFCVMGFFTLFFFIAIGVSVYVHILTSWLTTKISKMSTDEIEKRQKILLDKMSKRHSHRKQLEYELLCSEASRRDKKGVNY